jgi:hypothetical protein
MINKTGERVYRVLSIPYNYDVLIQDIVFGKINPAKTNPVLFSVIKEILKKG